MLLDSGPRSRPIAGGPTHSTSSRPPDRCNPSDRDSGHDRSRANPTRNQRAVHTCEYKRVGSRRRQASHK